jgi:hypothetical protein
MHGPSATSTCFGSSPPPDLATPGPSSRNWREHGTSTVPGSRRFAWRAVQAVTLGIQATRVDS